MMAHITYLADASMDRKFGAGKKRGPLADTSSFDVQSKWRATAPPGASFINRFDANSYLYITRSLDSSTSPRPTVR